MGRYDITFKHSAARWPVDFARLALGREDLQVATLSGDVPAQRREVDFTARVRMPDGDDFVLHLECEHRAITETPRGRAEGRAEAILRALQNRLGPPPASLAERLLAIDDLNRLDALLDLSLQAASLEAFARAV